MNQLSKDYFPVAGMNNLRFTTKDGQTHNGKYDFNETSARRWFDENGKQYTSADVIMWGEEQKRS